MASEMVLDLQDPSEDRNMLESRCFSGFWVSMRERESLGEREREGGGVEKWGGRRNRPNTCTDFCLVLVFVSLLEI